MYLSVPLDSAITMYLYKPRGSAVTMYLSVPPDRVIMMLLYKPLGSGVIMCLWEPQQTVKHGVCLGGYLMKH